MFNLVEMGKKFDQDVSGVPPFFRLPRSWIAERIGQCNCRTNRLPYEQAPTLVSALAD